MKSEIHAYARAMIIETEGDRCYIEIKAPFIADNEIGLNEEHVRELILALTKARQEMIRQGEKDD